jgi:anti-anti-sigma factor
MLDTLGSELRLDVERGPDWLFVRVTPPEGDLSAAPSLADAVWAVLEQSFTYRVVLDLEPIALVRSALLGQLVLLAKRVRTHDGLLRLCGMSADNRDVLIASRLDTLLPSYPDRSAAVMCSRPLPR